MKRTLVLLTLAAGIAVAASPASAATAWKGVVVAKDASRNAVVTASANGDVRTARSAKARSLRVGQRLAVSGTKLADGTYRAASVRVTGRSKTGRLKAVVVRNQRAQGRLLVSAGGSTFAIARRGGRVLASASDKDPKPGDKIVANVAFASGAMLTTALSTAGHLGTLEVEGILTKIDPASIELVVAKAGFVTLALPTGFALPAGLKVFDVVKLVVAVGTDGKLTLVTIQGDQGDKAGKSDDDDDGVDVDEDNDELEVDGTITALSTTSVTVTPRSSGSSASPVTCSLSAPLTGFAVNDRVELECKAGATAGTLVLKKIKHEGDEHADDDHNDDDGENNDGDNDD